MTSPRNWIVVIAVAALVGAAGAEEAPRLPPQECVRMLRGARIAHMEGDPARELETLRAAAAAFPEEIAPIYALLVYHRRHPLPAAEQRELRALLVRRFEDREGDLPVGVLARIANDPAAEESTLRLLAAHAARRLEGPETADPELLDLLATVQQRLGMEEAAAATLERLRRVQPSVTVSWRLYRLYLDLERWDAAADMLAALVGKERANHLRATYIRLLSRAGRVEEQARQIEIYLAESGADTLTHQRLKVLKEAAWELRDAGEDGEAERLFRRVLELDPEDEEARAVLLHLYGSEEERQRIAAAEAERWRQESDPQALFQEGTQRLTAGDAAAAVELLRRAAPELPELEAAWYNLGMAAYRLEDWDTAASAFGRAGELNPERAESFFFGGLALSQLGRCTGAVDALERALALDPGRSAAHYYLSICYRALGDGEAAARHRRLHDAAREQ